MNKDYIKDSKDFFNKVANKKYGNSYKFDRIILNHINLEKEENILDLGCGDGRFIDYLNALKLNLSFTGVDISEQVLLKAKGRKIKSAEFIDADIINLPLMDKSFDKIFCINSFHHYPEPELVIKEINRLIKKEGMVIIGDPYILPILRGFVNWSLPYGNSGDYHIYNEKEMDKLFQKGGFEKVLFKIVTPFLFLVIYKKNSF